MSNQSISLYCPLLAPRQSHHYLSPDRSQSLLPVSTLSSVMAFHCSVNKAQTLYHSLQSPLGYGLLFYLTNSFTLILVGHYTLQPQQSSFSTHPNQSPPSKLSICCSSVLKNFLQRSAPTFSCLNSNVILSEGIP